MTLLNKYQLHAAILRLLFAYNLIPENHEQEEKFLRDLSKIFDL